MVKGLEEATKIHHDSKAQRQPCLLLDRSKASGLGGTKLGRKGVDQVIEVYK